MTDSEETTCLACHGTYYSWQIQKHINICPEFKEYMKKVKRPKRKDKE